MAKNLLVINFDARETRVALIEDGVIAELHLERRGTAASTVGNVYCGKVTRVLPGLQAAFIDIGQERAAFLHVEDLIRPDDFDTFLAGGLKHAKSDGNADVADEADAADDGASLVTAPEAQHLAEGMDEDSANPEVLAAESSGEDGAIEAAEEIATEIVHEAEEADEAPKRAVRRKVGSADVARRPTLEPETLATVDAALSSWSELPNPPSVPAIDPDDIDDSADAESGAESDASADADDEDEGDYSGPNAVVPEAAAAGSTPAVAGATNDAGWESVGGAEADGDDLDFPDMPGFTITNPGDPVPRAVAPAARDRNDDAKRGRGRRGRGRGRGGRERERGPAENRPPREKRPERTSPMQNRISKTTPIRDVVKEGQEIIVQVTKDPIGTKGARCSSHVSLPGRYVVYLPTVPHVGISKRIGSDKERSRLREVIDSVKPPTGGLIVRTLAEGLTKKQLKQDVGYLVRVWGEIAKKREGAKAPHLLSSELDLVLKVARDLFTDEVAEVVIDDKNQYERLCRFVEMFAPDRVKNITLYDEEEPVFDAYGIEDEIARALARKVPLPSGGHLIIDQAEALTAIDVNTGRYVGKGAKDMEDAILKTNLEAVHEIAYQLRFRNIGGLIILDLIDMERSGNREKVRRSLDDLLQKDKAKTTLNRISDLGLIEMTRKRTRESLGRMLNEPCFYCDGTGQLQSKETVAYEIMREIRRKRSGLTGYTIVVNAHPAVADVLNGAERPTLTEIENKYMRKITVTPRTEYHIEQFDLVGK